MKRGIFDIALFLSLFLLPWWLGVLLAFVGIFLFRNFYEFIISGIIIYSVYIVPGKTLITSPLYFSVIILLIYIGIQILRQKIILYKNDF